MADAAEFAEVPELEKTPVTIITGFLVSMNTHICARDFRQFKFGLDRPKRPVAFHTNRFRTVLTCFQRISTSARERRVVTE